MFRRSAPRKKFRPTSINSALAFGFFMKEHARGEWSAKLTLPDHGRFARHPLTIGDLYLSVRPSSSSMAMKAWPSTSSISWIVQMLG